MRADNEFTPVDLTDEQVELIKSKDKHRIWMSELKK